MSAILVLALWLCLGALVVSFVLAPVESLGWWAGWLGPQADEAEALAEIPEVGPVEGPDAYVVFVSGIGSISGTELLRSESEFLDRLQVALPGVAIVRDVFPYAPSGVPLLTGQRVFAWFWRQVQRWRLSGTHILPAVLNIRNLFQVLVSADRRYGPLYSFGIARVVIDRLRARGYRRDPNVPVVLLGSSGGAQIAIGAAPYLHEALGQAPAIVTFGGVMSADRGIDEVRRLISLHGRRDRVYQVGRVVFPGRWTAAVSSPWNTAREAGRLSEREIGPIGHFGRGGYLDAQTRAGGQRSCLEITVRSVSRALREAIGTPDQAADRTP